MATLENVEKLRERAAVTYDEARAALDACGDDLLEAMLLLERQGKVPPPTGGAYSTKQEIPDAPTGNAKRAETLDQLIRRFAKWLRGVAAKCNRSHFVILRGEVTIANIPLMLLLLLMICAFWVVLPLLVLGLFFGYRYRVQGAVESISINQVMDSAAQAADELKTSIQNSIDEKKSTTESTNEKD